MLRNVQSNKATDVPLCSPKFPSFCQTDNTPRHGAACVCGDAPRPGPAGFTGPWPESRRSNLHKDASACSTSLRSLKDQHHSLVTGYADNQNSWTAVVRCSPKPHASQTTTSHCGCERLDIFLRLLRRLRGSGAQVQQGSESESCTVSSTIPSFLPSFLPPFQCARPGRNLTGTRKRSARVALSVGI